MTSGKRGWKLQRNFERGNEELIGLGVLYPCLFWIPFPCAVALISHVEMLLGICYLPFFIPLTQLTFLPSIPSKPSFKSSFSGFFLNPG